MFRFLAGQAVGAYLTKLATSGRYSRGVSTILSLVATRMGGPSAALGIWGVLSALLRRGR
jgi:hypothetical protein